MKICLQMGHINAKNNIEPSLRASTGAPGEIELTKRITDRVSSMLRDRGFEVLQTDACGNSDPKVTDTDWDLFLAIHGDADYAGDGGGGFIDFPDPSVDSATVESQRIKIAIESEYFKHSEILNTPHSNPNTKFYYMWRYLTANTPCCLIELGQVQDPHDKVLLADTNRIASAVTRGVCKAFNVPFDIPVPPTPPTPPIHPAPIDWEKKYNDLVISANADRLLLETLELKYSALNITATEDHALLEALRNILRDILL